MEHSSGVITENFYVVLETSNKKLMNNLRVGTLSRIISVNRVDRTVDVQPIVMEKINTKSGVTSVLLPEIHNIPYISGQYPKVNDYVICVHLDRTMRGIDLLTDSTSYIESNRNRHNLNDCIAIVINTKDEWNLVGTYTEVTSNIDLSGYTQIKTVVIKSGIQITSEVYDINLSNKYRIIINDNSLHTVEMTRVDELLNITDIPNDCSVYLYAR